MGSPLLKAVMVRGAAFSFVGAGTIGASGWFGTMSAAVIEWVNESAGEAGRASLGTGAVWIVWAGLSLAWVLTLLPESWFGKAIPDWLSVSGIFLPALVAGVPGPMGDFLRSVIETCGGLMVRLASNVLGM